MDINTIVVAGKLATRPEQTDLLDTGHRYYRLLITTRTDHPTRRTDVIPVTMWDPDDETTRTLDALNAGDRVSAAGRLQRRFWDSPTGRRSRLEVVADSIIAAAAAEEARP